MKNSTRDSQRARVYKAEREAFACNAEGRVGWFNSDLEFIKTMEPKELAPYIRRMFTRKCFVARFGECIKPPKATRFKAKVTNRGGACAVGSMEQRYGEGALVNWVVVHETAHTIHTRIGYARHRTWYKLGKYTKQLENGPSHGREFCYIYLVLVRFMLGKEAHDRLKAAFKANRVKYTLPRVTKPKVLYRLEGTTIRAI